MQFFLINKFIKWSTSYALIFTLHHASYCSVWGSLEREVLHAKHTRQWWCWETCFEVTQMITFKKINLHPLYSMPVMALSRFPAQECRWGSPHFATAHWGQLTEGCSLGAGETVPSATSCGQLKNQCHLKVHSMGVGGVLVAKHLNKCQMTEILWILYSWFSYFEQVLLIPI